MRVALKPFWLPKGSSAPDEYEDAFWPKAAFRAEGHVRSFAVADGATETSFSGIWADILTKGYWRKAFDGPDMRKSIERLRSDWHKRVDGKSLPWYAEEKVRMGAFSSLLGLTLMPARSGEACGQWTALAIGDSCLFHVRNSGLLTAFPLDHWQQFSNRPVLLSTNPESDELALRQIVRMVGEWRPGDLFYLMTDALACWFLRRYESDGKTPSDLSDLETQSEFNEMVQCERRELDSCGRPWLRDDDVTLLRVEVT